MFIYIYICSALCILFKTDLQTVVYLVYNRSLDCYSIICHLYLLDCQQYCRYEAESFYIYCTSGPEVMAGMVCCRGRKGVPQQVYKRQSSFTALPQLSWSLHSVFFTYLAQSRLTWHRADLPSREPVLQVVKPEVTTGLAVQPTSNRVFILMQHFTVLGEGRVSRRQGFVLNYICWKLEEKRLI